VVSHAHRVVCGGTHEASVPIFLLLPLNDIADFSLNNPPLINISVSMPRTKANKKDGATFTRNQGMNNEQRAFLGSDKIFHSWQGTAKMDNVRTKKQIEIRDAFLVQFPTHKPDPKWEVGDQWNKRAKEKLLAVLSPLYSLVAF
jgi:hypothetical protein